MKSELIDSLANKRYRTNIGIYIYTFLVVYTPNFFNNAYLNYALPFCYWLFGYFFIKPKKESEGAVNQAMQRILICGLLGTLFFSFRAVVAGVYILDIKNLRIIQSLSVLLSVFSFYYVERFLASKGASSEDRMKFLLNVCMIQFVIVCIMIALPDFRMKMLEIFYLDDNKDLSFTIKKRVYGIMMNYTFSGSVFHGAMAFLALLFGINSDKRFYFYIPCMLLIVFLNGRIGLFVFIISATILVLSNFIFNRNLRKTIKIAIILGAFTILSLSILPLLWPSTFDFFKNGFVEIVNYLKNGTAATDRVSDVDVLSTQLKSDLNIETFLLGAGHRIQNSGDIPYGVGFYNMYSDIGFLNDMYMGGVIYMLLLYIPYLKLVMTDKKNSYIGYICLFILIVSNLKGEVFRSSIILGMLVYSISVLNNKAAEEKYGKSISNNGNL